MLTDEIRANFVTMRDDAFVCARGTVFHGSGEYLGIFSPITNSDDAASIGTPGRATGNVRLNVADLKEPIVNGDSIQVLEPESPEAVTRSVLAMRYDHSKATVLITYGVKYG